MPTPPYSPARIEISIPTASYDGRFWGRYPNGDKPTGMAGTAAVSLATAATLSTQTRFSGSATVAAAVTAALSGGHSTGNAIRFHSGIYMWNSRLHWEGGVQWQPIIDSAIAKPNLYKNVTGLQVCCDWAELEGAMGDYTPLHNILNSLDTMCNSVTAALGHPFRYFLGVTTQYFGSSGGTPGAAFPAYFLTGNNSQGVPRYQPNPDVVVNGVTYHEGSTQNTNWVIVAPQGYSANCIAAINISEPSGDVVRRLQLLSQDALAQAANRPLFEGWCIFGETICAGQLLSGGAGSSGKYYPASIDVGRYTAGIQTLLQTVPTYNPQILYRLLCNFSEWGSGTNTQGQSLAQLEIDQWFKTGLSLPNITFGGPDPPGGDNGTPPNQYVNPSSSELTFFGQRGISPSPKDYRGILPAYGEIESYGQYTNHTFNNLPYGTQAERWTLCHAIANYFVNELHCWHWSICTVPSPPALNFEGDWLTYIAGQSQYGTTGPGALGITNTGFPANGGTFSAA